MSTRAYEFFLYSYFGAGKDVLEKAINRAYRDMASHTLTGFSNDDNKKKCKKCAVVLLRMYIKGEEDKNNILADVKMKNVEFKKLIDCKSKDDFDIWHFELSKNMRLLYSSGDASGELTYGQAQKWINMSLKYLYLFYVLEKEGVLNNVFSKEEYSAEIRERLDYQLDDELKKIIGKTYKYYHVPIDNYILKRIYNLEDINSSKIKKDGTTYKLVYNKDDIKSEAYAWSRLPLVENGEEDSYRILQKELREITGEYACALEWEFSNWIIGAIQ